MAVSIQEASRRYAELLAAQAKARADAAAAHARANAVALEQAAEAARIQAAREKAEAEARRAEQVRAEARAREEAEPKFRKEAERAKAEVPPKDDSPNSRQSKAEAAHQRLTMLNSFSLEERLAFLANEKKEKTDRLAAEQKKKEEALAAEERAEQERIKQEQVKAEARAHEEAAAEKAKQQATSREVQAAAKSADQALEELSLKVAYALQQKLNEEDAERRREAQRRETQRRNPAAPPLPDSTRSDADKKERAAIIPVSEVISDIKVIADKADTPDTKADAELAQRLAAFTSQEWHGPGPRGDLDRKYDGDRVYCPSMDLKALGEQQRLQTLLTYLQKIRPGIASEIQLIAVRGYEETLNYLAIHYPGTPDFIRLAEAVDRRWEGYQKKFGKEQAQEYRDTFTKTLHEITKSRAVKGEYEQGVKGPDLKTDAHKYTTTLIRAGIVELFKIDNLLGLSEHPLNTHKDAKNGILTPEVVLAEVLVFYDNHKELHNLDRASIMKSFNTVSSAGPNDPETQVNMFEFISRTWVLAQNSGTIGEFITIAENNSNEKNKGEHEPGGCAPGFIARLYPLFVKMIQAKLVLPHIAESDPAPAPGPAPAKANGVKKP